jgi:site-specific DNA-methyltransferase (adenine-specific)
VSNTIADVLAGRAPWAVECRDGFVLAREMGAGAVDHVIGDPPYDEQTHEGARTGDLDVGADSPIDFAPLPDLADILPSLIVCARRWTILFCTGAMLGDYKRAAGGTRNQGGAWIRDGYWHRTDGAPQKTGDRPAVSCEALAIMHARGGKMRWNNHGAQAFWEGVKARGEPGRHPTKKPPWLMAALIRDFTDPGDLIFDPTCGEGTTGVEAIKLGRRFIGTDIDRRWVDKAAAALAREGARPKQIEIAAKVPAMKQIPLLGAR